MKKYQIIYADPPWSSRKGQWTGYAHYPTMRIQDICSLPVEKISDENCILFLWTIGCHLHNALKVVSAWGFQYKTIGFNWAKIYNNGNPYSGMGHWVKQGSEICLLATKGKLVRANKGVRQLIIEPITTHSTKPAVARERIVTLMGDLPRIELFAREKTPGWDVWGNEVSCDIGMEDYCGD